MKKILILLLTTQCFVSFGQNETHLLNQFDYRTQGYLGINIFGDARTENQSLEIYDSKAKQYGINLNTTLFGQKITDKYQLNYSIGLNTDLNYGKSKNLSDSYKSQNVYLGLPMYISFKNFNSKNRFIGISLNEQPVIARNSATYSGLNTEYNNLSNYAIPSISIGKGRINNINPMEKTLWLLRDLKAEQLLTSELNETETIELANVLVQIENTRMFDFRKKNKFALDLILQKFKNHIDTKNVSKVLNAIQDNYYFAINMNRDQGEEIFLNLSMKAINQSITAQSEQLDLTKKSNNTIPTISINYNRYKSLNLKNQIDYGGMLFIGNQTSKYKESGLVNDTTIVNFTSKNDFLVGGFKAFLQHKFYPSTRSNIVSGVSTQLEFNQLDKLLCSISPYLRLNYLINFRMRINTEITPQYFTYFGKSNQQHNWQMSSKINFIYNLR